MLLLILLIAFIVVHKHICHTIIKEMFKYIMYECPIYNTGLPNTLVYYYKRI